MILWRIFLKKVIGNSASQTNDEKWERFVIDGALSSIYFVITDPEDLNLSQKEFFTLISPVTTWQKITAVSELPENEQSSIRTNEYTQ